MLQARGYSQREIGVLTGQSQPEVCGIVHGRQVRSYALLARIGAGLGVPPGYLGLAWCTDSGCQRWPGEGEPGESPRSAG